MANRGQKRTEAVDALPADKRACSSLESRPSSSNSSVQTPMSSAHEAQDADMEASSSTSGSTGSEFFVERESTHGSCDSENNTHDYQRHRSLCDQSKLQKVLQLLSKEGDESGQLAALTELCELLSFCTDGSISSLMVDTFSPVLVRLARNESNPEIMLLALRAITYFCDVNQRSSRFLVRDDVVPALCQRLITIEYLDVAEQCLQALAKISQEQPLACLQSDAIMAALTYIDFFSTSVQRVALSTAVNICKKLSSESPSHFMEAVPTLCSILQYEDIQLVESSVSCLIKIVEQVSCSSDMLDEICKNGLVQHSLHLIGLNAQTALSPQTSTGLIGLLAKLAAGSNIAFRTLLELNIGNKVKDMFSTSSDLSHGTRSTLLLDGKSNRLHQVLKLLNELLPEIAEQDGGQNSVKEVFLLGNPDILQKFGLDILPVLVQVVNSGVNLFICYGCLSVINKLIHFSTSDALHSLLQTTEFPSFLGGIFTRKDHHVILLALQIIDATMRKLPRVYLTSFIKEGIVFAMHALLSTDKDLTLSTLFDGIRMESNGTPRSTSQATRRCPCFGFDAGHSLKSPENTTCKLQKDNAQYLAKHILVTYFELESVKPDKGVTHILQKLRALSDALTAEVNKFQDEETYNLLKQIISELNKTDSVSTFEFVESGIMRALVSYLSNGRYIVGIEDDNAANFSWIMEKRLEVLGRLLLFSADNPTRGQLPLLALIGRLQSALSSIENFPVISSHLSKPKNSYALVPFGRYTSYPSLKVHFVREDGEVSLRDYPEDLVSVDPFVPLDAIEGYLWPRVSNRETKHLPHVSKDLNEKDIVCSSSPPNSNTSQGKIADTIVSDRMQVDDHNVQDGKGRLLSPAREASSYAQRPTGSPDADDVQTDPRELNKNNAQVESGLYMDSPECSEVEDTQRKLLFFLERKKLNGDLTLYQSILMQQTHDSIQNANLWTRLFRITYKRGMKSKRTHAKFVSNEAQSSFSSETASFSQGTRFFSHILLSAADPEILGPTYDVLFLLNVLEAINRLRFHITFRDRTLAFAEGRTENLDNLNVEVHGVPQNEFVNKKLTEKLDQLIFDNVAVSAGAMPAWCTQLIAWCPFLFGFDARCKYFRLAALGRPPIHADSSSHGHAGGSSGRQQNHGSTSRRKVMVHRDRILESAAEMMKLYSRHKVVLEVEYEEEVGSGLGPTLEFYTLVCQEFQRIGLCMWRDDPLSHGCLTEYSGSLPSHFGLFPRPMSPAPSMSSNKLYSEVIKKYALLGQIVAKALQDGRVLDLPLSKAFYKLILGKELTVYDIQSFDPALGKALLELLAVVERTKYLSSLCEEKSKSNGLELGLRCTKIEDLCLDFSLPGYPDYLLITESDSKMVNLDNLEEYISLVVEATIKSGIARQVEAFKSGFSEVFHIAHLKVFMEEELERLLCGEQVLWNSNDLLDHIKFDHGYTVSSPPIVNLLEIMREFDPQQQRAFLQFVTGAPRLPIGGLASLNPKLTIVRKHCNKVTDTELPSVMTCANYLKLPPYSCREVMKERLLYAITEGQGSFHLS